MSGIAGIFHVEIAKPVDPARMRAMAAAQERAGVRPDVWTGRGIGFGGSAPIVSRDGKLAAICDGLICNAAALRARLELLGHEFETEDDREVILQAWRQWGAGCVEHMDGPFAIALFDARRHSLFLARDRIGERPLHYARLGDGSLIFSSSISALIAHPLLRRELNVRAVDDYLALGYVPDDTSIIAGISKLPAAHCLRVTRGKALPPPQRWWDLDSTRRARGSATALADGMLGHLSASIRARTADNSGALMTDGVEGLAVVALMAEQSSRAVQTIAIRAGDDPAAEAIVRRFATDHHSRQAGDRDFTLIDALAGACDEPFADPGLIAHWRLYEAAAERLSVALTGEGGEALAGPDAGAWMKALLQEPLKRFGLSKQDGHPGDMTLIGAEQRAALYGAHGQRALKGHRPEQRFREAYRAAPTRGGHRADLTIALPGRTLAGIDRIARATGIEVRHPMLDHRLIEFAAGLPPWRGGGRQLLRRAMGRYLPDQVLDQPVKAHAVPLDQWFRGPLIDTARRLTRGSALSDSGLFDMGAIARLVSDHLSGAGDNGRILWQMVMLDRSLARLFGLGRQSG